MFPVLWKLVEFYNFVFVDYVDPRSGNWFLAASPGPPALLVACYLYVVFNLGPRFMAGRPPFKIERLLIVYNAAQIAVCMWIVRVGIAYAWHWGGYNILCQPVDHEINEINEKIANAVYVYYVLKIVDLLDTIFFLMRKKFSQVTFLHVYHHAGMVLVGFLGCKYSLNGHFTLLGVVNSQVHVVMYGYYLLAAWYPDYAKRALWLKKGITLMQLAQFALLSVHAMLPLLQPSCGVQKVWCALLIMQYSVMTVLFTDFYRKTYLQKKQAAD